MNHQPNLAAAFEPLPEHEQEHAAAGNGAARPTKEEWRPILPAPADVLHPDHKHPELGQPSATWPLLDADGRLLCFSSRFETEGGGKEFRQRTYGTLNGRTGWHWKAPPTPRPLYGLDRLAARPDAAVIVVEGEKKCAPAEDLFAEYVAVSALNGAESANKAEWSPLAGRKVTVWPDHDKPGADFAATVVKLLRKTGATSVSVVRVPPEFEEGWDLADALPDGWSANRFRGLLDAAADGNAPGAAAKPKVGASPFEQRPTGIYYRDPDPEKDDLLLCGPLDVVAEMRDADGNSWGVLLNWLDPDGRLHEWAMPRSMLAADGAEYRRQLLDGGLYVAPGRRAREMLTAYLASARAPQAARAAARVGWHGRAFVLPGAVYGDTGGERVVLQTATRFDHAFRVAGTLEEWQDGVARYAAGNSRLILALSAAFAAPLVHLVAAESGGFHFRGSSSIGKDDTLCLRGFCVGRWRREGLYQAMARHRQRPRRAGGRTLRCAAVPR